MTKTKKDMNIDVALINAGSWTKISIIDVQFGYSRMRKDGEWVNTTINPQRFESEILTLGKCFYNNEEAEKFMKTKPFKSLLNNLKKNWEL